VTRPLDVTSAGTAGPEALLESLLDSAYATALRLTGDPAAAETLVQEAALASARSGRPADFRCRFFRELVSAWRSRPGATRPYRPALDLDDTPDLYLYARFIQSGLPVAGHDPAAVLLDALGPDRVAEAVNCLPPDYRLVCLLHYMLDPSYAELGEVLDWPAGAVRSRLHRGRKMLQQVLWHLAERDGILERLRETGGGLG
jgi:RNA polymerase sigma-70 factor (ECF subfamily)